MRQNKKALTSFRESETVEQDIMFLFFKLEVVNYHLITRSHAWWSL